MCVMGTEVLRPQDVLVARLGVHTPSFQRRRHFQANGNQTNLIVNKKQNYTGYRKTSPKRKINAAAAETRLRPPKSTSDQRRKDEISTCGSPVMGKVTLLRRGESLSSIVAKMNGGKSSDDLDVRGGENIREPLSSIVAKINGPIGEIFRSESHAIVLNQVRPHSSDIYAGSAFFASPSPRCVPLPSFFNMKVSSDDDSESEISQLDDGRTKMLRRLLRLD